MPSVLSPILFIYEHTLQPLSSLSWMGAPISTLDVAAAFRLAVILRQLREGFHQQHVARVTNERTVKGVVESEKQHRSEISLMLPAVERRARTRDFATTLIMVYGGEAIVGVSCQILLYVLFKPAALRFALLGRSLR